MKKIMILTACALFAASVSAANVDLKQNMKQMKLEFKQAAEATSVETMQAPINRLSQLVEESKLGNYPPEKQDLYLEGFNKLSVALDKIEVDLEQGNLEQAQQTLRTVDELRVEYHEQRNPSIWKRLFG
ncbi:cytochrome b562 family protein [Vibrio qinghaiensis]|uniref:Cytochrome b562 family protein n=2 Tax=Vibrio TaxID=662 RepID=A0A223N1W6_9VIBR|nr:cytochrome b562 [Vibrio qinghaiensis]ASU23815.1 cytochrome b562 family protein [Vibrio qinghaiensis]